MGRYLEEEVSLPQEITSLSNHPTAYLRQLDNGDLALIEKNAGLYLSSDHGETWTKQQTPGMMNWLPMPISQRLLSRRTVLLQ